MKYKTIRSESLKLIQVVEETGYATFSLYYSEDDKVFKCFPEPGVEVFGKDMKTVIQEAIDYIVTNRVEVNSTDKRRSKYTLKK